MKAVNLKEKYEKDIAPQIREEFDINNKLATPKVQKVVINMGIGAIAKDKRLLKTAQLDLAAITGQKPSLRPAKIDVAGFSLRKGMPVGLSVTLRGNRKYDFLQRLFSIVLPRLRDFRGTKLNSFDNQGNYTLGLADYSVFPEIDLSKGTPVGGLEITIVTSAKSKKQARKLLKLLGMPFQKKEKRNV